VQTAEAIIMNYIVPHRIIWSLYTGRWWVGCYRGSRGSCKLDRSMKNSHFSTNTVFRFIAKTIKDTARP